MEESTLTDAGKILDLVASFVGSNDVVSVENDETLCRDSNDLDYDSSLTGRSAVVKVVVFTKDRPWQLEQLFRSMRFQQKHTKRDEHRTLYIQLVVVACVTNDFCFHYDAVRTRLEQSIASLDDNVSLEFVLEDEAQDSFESCMWSVFNQKVPRDDDVELFWMFLTDDCVLLVSLWQLLQTAVGTLVNQSRVVKKDQCFLSRLHPGISWCQTRNQPSPPPRNIIRYQSNSNISQSTISEGAYVYNLSRATGDSREWAYPIDLSGGVYPNQLVKEVLQQLKGTWAMSHPNRLEICGNEVLEKMRHDSFKCCIPTRPYLVVLAINRVQTLFRAPLACQEDKADSLEAKALLKYLKDGAHLDLDRYRTARFDSSHVGQVWLQEKNTIPDSQDEHRPSQQPALSVLIPIRHGPPHAAAHAMASIVMQPIEELNLAVQDCGETGDNERKPASPLRISPMQIVLVDDGCVDGSVDTMLNTAQELVHGCSNARLTVSDRRHEEGDVQQNHDVMDGSDKTICIAIEIYSSSRPGISEALNIGLQQCRSEFVARMDADDISSPGRLVRQALSLQRHPRVSVVGMHSLVFRLMEFASTTQETIPKHSVALPTHHIPYSHLLPKEYHNSATTTCVRPSLYPTLSGLLSWAMLFSCCLAHPSVMFRKGTVNRVGGYSAEFESAEDYHLWLRLVQADCHSVETIPMIGLWHRKHPLGSLEGNTKRSKQAQGALQACMASIEELLSLFDSREEAANTCNCVVSEPVVSVLRRPSEALSLEQMDDAMALLLKLEAAFLHKHQQTLTVLEKELVKYDCDARIGDLAALCVTKFGTQIKDSSRTVWQTWVERCPHQGLERIALLCHEGGDDAPAHRACHTV